MSDDRRRVVMGDGCALATVTSGTAGGGLPWVLLHGGPGAWDYLAPLAGLLDDRALVHRFDSRGCGASEAAAEHSVARLVADVEDLRHYWGHERWIVLGHSFGAAVALQLAWQHPDRVAGLAYVSGTGIGDWVTDYRRTRASRLTEAQQARLAELKRLGTPTAEQATLTAIPDFVRATDAEAWVRSAPARTVSPRLCTDQVAEVDAWEEAEVERRCTALTVPVLALRGAADPRPGAPVRRLVDALPNGRLVEMSGAGHFPWLERPDAVRDALLGWAEGLS